MTRPTKHRVKLIDDWRRVLRRAWSIRLTLLSAALGGVELALPLFSDAVPRNTFAALSVAVAVAAAGARLVAQDKTMGQKQ